MMEYVEKNKRLLAWYFKILRILGWILLCMGIIGFAMLISESYGTGGRVTFDGTLGTFKRSYHHFVKIGLLSLGLAQLVRYFCENKIGLLLRHGDKIFYLYAIIVVWGLVGQVWLVATGKMGANSSLNLHWLIFFLPTLLYNSAKVLLSVGLGQFLKQFIAKIENPT